MSLLVPFTEKTQCNAGHSIETKILYAAYVVFSVLLELSLCYYIQKTVGDRKVLQINKFHFMKIITG